MSFIVEAALDVFFEALFSKIGSLNFKLFCCEQVHKEIEKWNKTLKMVSAVLADAERKQMQNHAVKIWLADLKDLAYDVDDILDEFASKALKRILVQKHHEQASKSKIIKLFTFRSTYRPSTIKLNKKMVSKMREITERLESLAAQKSEFQLTDQNVVKGEIPKLPESSSLVDGTAIYGRQKDKDEILGLLLSNDDNISVIPIVGMGGIGKTTLAQLVYNDDSIKDHFDRKAWVCVSNEFNIVNITKTILLSVSSRPFVENDLNSLQVKLKKKLSGKKFLLVLDDVWNENYGDWDVLKRPFAAGAPGSKVIVTTRNSKVSSLMRTVPNHHLLQKLSDDDSLCILSHHALGATDFSGHSELEVIGREIMKKCDGLPLATKTIGGLLRNNFSREAWQHILESQLWHSTEDKNQIMPALRLSYYHLPSRLKQCFACCSLIPKDYEFEEEEIISLWMADGFLHQTNAKLSSEDFCRQDFEELVSRSFFQAASKENSKFIMHDLINELAQSVAQGFYFRMEEYQQMEIPSHTRHLSVRDYVVGFQKFQNNYEAKHLRTFHSFRKPSSSYLCLSHIIVGELMSKLKYLRVFSLKRYEICEIPDSIGNLIHLRCLDFSYTRIKCLPDSICDLYNLEILKLRGCGEIRKLPSKIGILVDLCHLDISWANSIQEMPSGIGILSNLQVLSNFIVGQGDAANIGEIQDIFRLKGDAANIREMQDLLRLKGKLSISGLQNVNEASDALEAKMSKKTGLSDLKLEWSDNFDEILRKTEVERAVLSFLEPHKELKVLTISYYAGESFASWIEDPSFKNLQSLTLEGCWNCKSLPAVGKLPLLKDLCIKGMNGVTSVGNEFYGENLTNVFPSLESLRFEDMPEWQVWGSREVDEQGKFFHRLRMLHIRNCPKLVKRFSVNYFCSLEELQIYECKELEVLISTLPKLRALKIDGCKEVVFGSYNDLCSVKEVLISNISKETVMSESMKVESLNVNASWWHTKWGWLAPLESLSVLKIKGCAEVVSVGATKIEEEEKEGHLQLNISCNIRQMKIKDCECFEKISSSFQNLRCLSQLKIKKCGKLVSVESNSLPPTLKYLEIDSCENVQCLLEDREDMNFSSTSLLESLVVKECKALKCLSSSGKLPACLKYLDIVCCSELEFVADKIGTDACLDSISISGCEKIKKLPHLLDKLSSLCSIDIKSCPELERLPESGLPTYANLKSMVLKGCEKLQALPKLSFLLQLEVLEIHECPELESTFSDSSFGLPTNLVQLTVGSSDMSKAVMEWGLHRLNSLEKLIILDSEWFPRDKHDIEMKLPASLTSLTFGHLKNVERISSNTFQNLTCLQTLSIDNCPKLKSLPKGEMLPSLGTLSIRNCPKLKKMCQRDKGELWSNIANIPWVEIDFKHIYE